MCGERARPPLVDQTMVMLQHRCQLPGIKPMRQGNLGLTTQRAAGFAAPCIVAMYRSFFSAKTRQPNVQCICAARIAGVASVGPFFFYSMEPASVILFSCLTGIVMCIHKGSQISSTEAHHITARRLHARAFPIGGRTHGPR